MKRLMYFAISVVLASVCEGQAVRGLADVSIIDPGQRGLYSTRITIMASIGLPGGPAAAMPSKSTIISGSGCSRVTSVDGVNVVSGETAAWDQGGYVFGPGDRYQITGWRKSDAEVAAFTFTDLANSYAARTGRPGERRGHRRGGFPASTSRRRSTSRRSAAYPPSSRTLPARLRTLRAWGVIADVSTVPRWPLRQPREKLGTGHGERDTRTSITRNSCACRKQPNQIIRIHYDSIDNLFAMGIVTRPRPMPPVPEPVSGLTRSALCPGSRRLVSMLS